MYTILAFAVAADTNSVCLDLKRNKERHGY